MVQLSQLFLRHLQQIIFKIIVSFLPTNPKFYQEQVTGTTCVLLQCCSVFYIPFSSAVLLEQLCIEYIFV